MDVQEQNGCNGSDTLLSESHKISLPAHSKEEFTTADDFAPKARKPYTITKQRERWTEEEHKKFLEALKLYGRAWRRIEEHVGSKTAVQIRSHAQKFFSKVVRESSTGDADSGKPIEIPPPRPKRKPMHPYPRKQVSGVKTGISIPENQSPTSVLSALGSDSSSGMDSSMPKFVEDVMSSVPDCEDENSSPNDQVPMDLELSSSQDGKESSSQGGQSMKLFGKTFTVVTEARLSPLKVIPVKFSETSATSVYSSEIQSIPFSARKSSESNACCPVSFQWLRLCNNVPEVHSPTPIRPIDEQKEGSFTGSNNSDSVDGKNREADSFCPNEKSFSSYKLSKRISAKCGRGFVPYKRCVAERGSSTISSTDTTQERETQPQPQPQRIRLCL